MREEWKREVGRGGGYGEFGKLDQLCISSCSTKSLYFGYIFCVADRIVWNEFVLFEITNKFLFIFQQGMQCLEMYAAPRASLAKVTFCLFVGLT